MFELRNSEKVLNKKPSRNECIFQQYVNFVYDFLKPASLSQRSRKYLLSYGLNERLKPQPFRSLTQDNPQRRFEDAFQNHIQTQGANTKLRYTYRYLERSTVSCVFEVVFWRGDFRILSTESL